MGRHTFVSSASTLLLARCAGHGSQTDRLSARDLKSPVKIALTVILYDIRARSLSEHDRMRYQDGRYQDPREQGKVAIAVVPTPM